jgi:glycerol-3-phosphate dehydrogenase
VEGDDFASGTSSRSTKLIHGGVRYLEHAVKKFDRSQLHLVRDALQERATLLKLAPHLSHPLPLVTPLYRWMEIPYYRVGLKIYDWLAGKQNLKPSRYLKPKEALKNFPMLKAKGLRGGVLYYDGQFNDARMNVSLALTAIQEGAVALNHVRVTELIRENGRLKAAVLHNTITGEELTVAAKVIINATGPFVDSVRKMDDPEVEPLLKASSGIHIVLAKRFSPPGTGLLIPKTEDGRVLFLLPWLGHTLVGTTDNPAPIEAHPKPRDEDIEYILRHLEKYFDIPVAREDVLAAWSGLRPLVSNPKAADTARLSRDHIVHISPSGLLTVTGGKWTTYRKMAQDAVDQAIRLGALPVRGPSRTDHTLLWGAEGFSEEIPRQLIRDFGFAEDIAGHLAESYGSHALDVASLTREGYASRLAPDLPFLEAEIPYGIQRELAYSAIDLLSRRMRLAFLNHEAAIASLPRTLEIHAQFLGWGPGKVEAERKAFLDYLSWNPDPLTTSESAEKRLASL